MKCELCGVELKEKEKKLCKKCFKRINSHKFFLGQ